MRHAVLPLWRMEAIASVHLPNFAGIIVRKNPPVALPQQLTKPVMVTVLMRVPVFSVKATLYQIRRVEIKQRPSMPVQSCVEI